MKRFLTSTAISSAERKILHQTSLGLFRILKRIINVTTGKDDDYMLLQPPLNHRDYGQARVLNSTKSLLWRDEKIHRHDEEDVCKKILTFFKTWAQPVDTETKKEVGNFDELFGISNSKDKDEQDEDGDSPMPELSLYVSKHDLNKAIHKGFMDSKKEKGGLTKRNVLDLQRFAIDSIKLLEDQRRMWDRTSISIDKGRGIRVIAVSRCIGVSSSYKAGLRSESDLKHRFAYRIRIDNINDPEIETSRTVQLLGRSWKFSEDAVEGVQSKNSEVNVVAPTTGTVGWLPVIQPGTSFEYMSGCELGTLTGTMSGCFHMATVDKDTKSAHVGDPVGAFHLPKENHFEMKVLPLKLVAEQF